MPFTISHIAVVKPLQKIFGKRTVFLPLVIGSVMPDLFYFLPINFSRSFSHSIYGMFILNLPAALILFYLFGFVGRKPLRELLPRFVQRKMKPMNLEDYKFRVMDFLIIVCAVIVGIFSHLLWDNLTHESWISSIFPLHLKEFFVIYKYFPLYDILQHVSSLLGLGVVVFYFFKWMKDTRSEHSAERIVSRQFIRIWRRIIIFFSFLLPALVSLVFFSGNSLFSLFKRTLYFTIFGGGSMLFFVVGLYILNWWIVVLRKRKLGLRLND